MMCYLSVLLLTLCQQDVLTQPPTTSLAGGQPADGTRSLARAAVCGRPGVLRGRRARTKPDEAAPLAMKGAAHCPEERTTPRH